MQQLSTDILVIGSGGAGLRAALSAWEANPRLDITCVSRGEPGAHGVTAVACSDRMAFHVTFPFTEPGGESAIAEHAKDIFENGGFASDPNLADLLARDSAEAYERLVKLGVPFALDESGRPDQFVTDGSLYARACYTGPYTARDIEKALISAVTETDIRMIGNLSLASILKDEDPGKVSGALFISEGEDEWIAIAAKAVILATGGPGGIFKENVFPDGMDANPWFAALDAGASLVNLEFIQFGLASPETSLACSGSLMRAIPRITANGRNLLEDIYDISPEYDPAGLLFRKGSSWPVSAESPARAVDIAISKAIAADEKVEIDYTLNPDSFYPGYLANDFPEVLRNWFAEKNVVLESEDHQSTPIERLRGINPMVIDWFGERAIDLAANPIEIRHAAQHFQGGIRIDRRASAGVPGLYACGECAGGQHGANRPGGNSLMDCQVMGHIAGTSAADYATIRKDETIDISDAAGNAVSKLHTLFTSQEGLPPEDALDKTRGIMSGHLGVIRTPDGLATARTELIEMLRSGVNPEGSGNLEFVTARSAMLIGYAVARATMNRNESRGAHMLFENSKSVRPLPNIEKMDYVWNRVTFERNQLIVTMERIPERTPDLKLA